MEIQADGTGAVFRIVNQKPMDEVPAIGKHILFQAKFYTCPFDIQDMVLSVGTPVIFMDMQTQGAIVDDKLEDGIHELTIILTQVPYLNMEDALEPSFNELFMRIFSNEMPININIPPVKTL